MCQLTSIHSLWPPRVLPKTGSSFALALLTRTISSRSIDDELNSIHCLQQRQWNRVLLLVVGWECERRFCGVSISHSPRSKAVAHFILNAYSGQYICMDVWHVNLMGGGSIHCQWLCTHQSQLFFTSNINEREIICHISSFHGFSSFLVQLWQLLLLLTCSHWLYKESDWLKTGLTGVFCSSMLWKQSLPYIFEWEIKCNPQLKSAIRTKFHHTSFNLLRKKMTRRNMMLHPLMLT